MCTSAHVRNALHWNLKKEIKEITHLSDEEIAVIHKRFNSISNKGRLDYKNFEKSLGILGTIKNAYLYSSIFKAFDTNDDGYLDFYEFCVAINTMLKGTKREKVKLSYRIVHAGGSAASGEADEADEAVDRAADHSTNRAANRPADHSTNRAANRAANRPADRPANRPAIRDYSDYISYEQFKEIVLSINDIKKQLLGTEEKIQLSQISYTFKSLSMLCDDGKYRMNLKCYRKAVKCNEFLRLLGIHNKVADAFINSEFERRKKIKSGRSRLSNNSGFVRGEFSRRLGSNHRVKSFSVSTNTRLSLGKGSASSLFSRGRKKKSGIEGGTSGGYSGGYSGGTGGSADPGEAHNRNLADQSKKTPQGSSPVRPPLSSSGNNNSSSNNNRGSCAPLKSIVIQSSIAAEGEPPAKRDGLFESTLRSQGKGLIGKGNYLNVPRSGDGSRRSRSCATAGVGASPSPRGRDEEAADEEDFPKKGSSNDRNRKSNRNRAVRDADRGVTPSDSPMMMTEGSDSAKRGVEDASRKPSCSEGNDSYQQSCQSSSFHNSVMLVESGRGDGSRANYQPSEGSRANYQPSEGSRANYQPSEGSRANYQPSEGSSRVWDDHSDVEVVSLRRGRSSGMVSGTVKGLVGGSPTANPPYKCTVTERRDSRDSNEQEGPANDDPSNDIPHSAGKHECEILKAILKFEKQKENKMYVEEYNEYVKGYRKFAEEQEEGYLLDLDTYSDGKEELEREMEGGKHAQYNEAGGGSSSAYEDMGEDDSVGSVQGNHPDGGTTLIESRCEAKGGDKHDGGRSERNASQEDAEVAAASATEAAMAAGEAAARVENAKYLYKKYFEYKEFLEHSRCPISHSHNGLMMSSSDGRAVASHAVDNRAVDAHAVKHPCCEEPPRGSRAKGGKCAPRDGGQPRALLEFSSDVIRKKFYIPTSKCHYVMVNENLTKEQVLYHLGNIVVATEDYLSKERDGGGDYNRIFFFFFHVFKYHVGGDSQEGGPSKRHGEAGQQSGALQTDQAGQADPCGRPHRDEPSNESQMSSKNLRATIYYNVLLVTQIVKYFLHTITISHKCSSSYDSLEDSSRLGSINEVSVLLSHTSHLLATYSKGTNNDRKIYINKSNYYHKLTRRGKLSVSLRQKKKKRNLQKILAVYFGHERWDLVMNMMIGIRLSAIKVYNTSNIINLFKHKDLLELPTSNAQHRVVFKNYAPVIFKQIRSLYGIRSKEYISSVGPEQVISNMVLGNLSTLSELLSEGKSGSLFYFTSNGKYIIKTVCKNIHNLSKALLPKYYNHIRSNPDSLLTRLYGIHCIKYKSGSARSSKKIYFIVMNNFFSSAVEIHRRYDIKGSLVGRTVPPAKREDHTIALKDVDIDELGDRINVGEKNKQKLLQVIKADADFLKENYLLDYSLLFGIHYKDLSRDLVSWNASRTNEVRHVFDEDGKCIAARPFHQCDHGGMISIDKNKIFFFGIIDIFTKWTLKKKFEHTLRTIQKFDRQNISCIHPNAYAERFATFIEKHME
ncbi:phosphatidylinositol-4-phosphate 5-kinase [Plasmodium vivax North Korean]|uniref:Phosphatidylinositol-4-phosphate 5-kinase n=1 Tax=Plasmodium vivax North Korean TaxID=1035514 RepID=A0A0J9U275_PLAVI|nr:phosphatidylinositol-4-phosphate 5-kinase [Plasmodium vivax North Korean]